MKRLIVARIILVFSLIAGAAGMAASLEPEDKTVFQAIIQRVHGLFAIPGPNAPTFELRTIPPNCLIPSDIREFEVENHAIRARVSASDGRLLEVVDTKLFHERLTKTATNSGSQPHLTRAEAELKARGFAGSLGIKMDESFRPWTRFWSAPTNNYHSRHRDWSFLWNRHIGELPIYNERVNVSVDDLSGRVFQCSVSTLTNYTAKPIKPQLPIGEGREKALAVAKALWGKDVGSEADRWQAYREVGGNPLCYYLQAVATPSLPRSSKMPGAAKLRLVYVVLIGSYRKDPDAKGKQWFSTSRRVMIDAVSGEYVPMNAGEF